MADSIITTLRLIGQRSYVSGMDSAARSVNRLERSNRDAEGGLSLFQSRLGGVRGALGLVTSALTGTGIALGALAIYVGKTGIEFNANMERTKVGIGTLLHDSQKTEKVFKSVQRYALKSPILSVADAMQSTQQMLGAGMNSNRAESTLKAFSNTLSAMGRGPEDLKRMTYAFQQMLSKGQISAEELRGQLGEIFPASKLLAKRLGITTQELASEMKKGNLKGKKYVYMLLDEMNKKYKGATKRYADTFTGMMTNLQENIKYTAGLLTEDLMDPLKGLMKMGSGAMKKVQKFAQGGGPKQAVNAVVKGATKGNAPETQGLANSKKWQGTLFKVGKIARSVFDGLKKYAIEFWNALKPMEPFITNILLPFAVGFGKGLLDGITGVIPLIKVLATVLGWIGQKFAFLKPVMFFIGYLIGFIFGPAKLGVFRIFGRMIGFVVTKMTTFVTWLTKVSNIALRIGVGFLELGGKISRFVSGAVGKIKGMPGRLINVGKDIVRTIISGLKGLAGGITALISGAVGSVTEAAVNLGAAIWDGIKSGIMSVIPDPIKNTVSGALGLSQAAPKSHGGAMPTVGGRRKRAHGGLASGPTLVGEQGPELLHVPGPGMISPIKDLGGSMSSAVSFQVISPIYLNQRQIGQAVMDDQSDRMARR